jgi:replicative DNA helicase
VRSGFHDLDAMTSGFQPATLVVLAARPSVGKTSLALNIAQHVAMEDKIPVAVFSLEMSRWELFQRFLVCESGVNSNALRSGKLGEGDWEKISTAWGRLSEGTVMIDDRPGVSPLEIRAKARRMQAQHKIGLIIIDYIQLMSGSERTENRQQEVSEISRSLKAMARELEVPVIALSQLSRAPEQRGDRRPQLSDLRESGAIEQDADQVLFLYREGLHEKDVSRSQTDLIVAKNRNGPTGTVQLQFQESRTRFVNVSRMTPPPGTPG